MITITFDTFSTDELELKNKCMRVIPNWIGEPDQIIEQPDSSDPEGSYAIWFHYKSINMADFEFWTALETFAVKNEKYVVVYDHQNNKRKGYWYDEESEWIEQDVELPETIKALG